MEYSNIKGKVDQYNSILTNTTKYRKKWNSSLKKMIKKNLTDIIKQTKLPAFIDIKDEIENLEVIAMSLGTEISGIAEKVGNNQTKRPYIKSNGSLIFQQLFNGKIMIMIMYPFIEGYGQPKPLKTLEILRPHEMTEAFLIRYVEEFMREVIEWEDFDDDLPEKMGMTPIGFGVQQEIIGKEAQ